VAGGAAGVGKLLLKGFIAGGAAVELRFNDTIPDSRPKQERFYNQFKTTFYPLTVGGGESRVQTSCFL